mgnify:CR=1 FL=1
MEEIKKSIGGDMPWIIFNLCQNKFAVCSDMISGMTELPSEIVPIPTANKALRGVGVIRGQIVPLIDLREFFNMRSLDAEYEEFKEMLERRTGLTVHLWDERLTTVAADKAMIEAGLRREERKEHVDKVAAVFILQGFLDHKAMQKKVEE